MKRLSLIVVLALLVNFIGGCRYAVVESDPIQVFGTFMSARAEGNNLFIIEEVDPGVTEVLEDYKTKKPTSTPKVTPTPTIPPRTKVTPVPTATPLSMPEPMPTEMVMMDFEVTITPEPTLTPAPTPEPTLDATPAATPEPSVSPTKAVIGFRSRDENGEDGVYRLQMRLAELGYLEKSDADGKFGSMTLKALKKFQSEQGLEQTGVLDEATEAALNPKPAVTTAPEDVLFAEGATGDTVRMVQERMRQYGFTIDKPSGEFDADTTKTVMAFQQYAVALYGTEFDDPLTTVETTLLPDDAPAPTPTPQPDLSVFPDMPALEPEATLRPHHATDGVVSQNLFAYLRNNRFPVYQSTVQLGDWGDEVERVQRRLTSLDYYYEDVDGDFGEATATALKTFQKHNGLQQTGIADRETQLSLFSVDAVAAEWIEKPFYIKVSIDDQRVYVYRWDDGDYRQLIKTMICSTGLGNSTPKGVFVSPGHRDARWHYFVEFNCWAQYAFIIRGGILFHSVIYSSRDESSLRTSTVNALGHKASHGCIRLMVEDAKWIYEHCGAGQVIEIY